jgi:hypothetical protein
MRARHRRKLASAYKAVARARAALQAVFTEYERRPYGRYWEEDLRVSELAAVDSRLQSAGRDLGRLLYHGTGTGTALTKD